MARMAKYPTFKFEVLKASRVMISPGKLQYVHLSQSLAIKVSLPYNAQYHGPIQMAAQMLPWGLNTFGKSLLRYWLHILYMV